MHVLDVEVISLELIVITRDACQVVYSEQNNFISVLIVKVFRPALIESQVGVGLLSFTIALNRLALNVLEREVTD